MRQIKFFTLGFIFTFFFIILSFFIFDSFGLNLKGISYLGKKDYSENNISPIYTSWSGSNILMVAEGYTDGSEVEESSEFVYEINPSTGSKVSTLSLSDSKSTLYQINSITSWTQGTRTWAIIPQHDADGGSTSDTNNPGNGNAARIIVFDPAKAQQNGNQIAGSVDSKTFEIPWNEDEQIFKDCSISYHEFQMTPPFYHDAVKYADPESATVIDDTVYIPDTDGKCFYTYSITSSAFSYTKLDTFDYTISTTFPIAPSDLTNSAHSTWGVKKIVSSGSYLFFVFQISDGGGDYFTGVVSSLKSNPTKLVDIWSPEFCQTTDDDDSLGEGDSCYYGAPSEAVVYQNHLFLSRFSGSSAPTTVWDVDISDPKNMKQAKQILTVPSETLGGGTLGLEVLSNGKLIIGDNVVDSLINIVDLPSYFHKTATIDEDSATEVFLNDYDESLSYGGFVLAASSTNTDFWAYGAGGIGSDPDYAFYGAHFNTYGLPGDSSATNFTDVFTGTTTKKIYYGTSTKATTVAPLSTERKSAIEWLANKGITGGSGTCATSKTGTKSTCFKASDAVNRGSMAIFLQRLSGEKSSTKTVSTFADVKVDPNTTDKVTQFSVTYKGQKKATKVAYVSLERLQAIDWLYANQITGGSGETSGGKDTFRPQDAVNRGAMASFLEKFLGHTNVPSQTSPFPDIVVGTNEKVILKYDGASKTSTVSGITAARNGAINYLSEIGITGGSGKYNGITTFRPQDKVNRGSMATFLKKVYDIIK